MSAYVVEDKTINDIVNGLASGRECEYIKCEIGEAGYDLDTYQGKKTLAEDMFRCNVAAVEDRYGKGEADKFRPLDFEYGETIPLMLVNVYKALQCWLYQCSEGIPDSRHVYILMDRVSDRLAHKIVCMMPEYDRLPWGR